MKKITLQAICLLVAALFLLNCNSSSSKEDMQKDLQKDVQKDLQKNKPEAEPGDSPSTDGPKEVMSVADAKKFLGAADANKGKLVTVSAYPKGMTKAINGEFMLYLSDKTGTGLTNENFACVFKEEMRGSVKTNKADELVTVKGNIAWKNGMIVLKNARLGE
jgi:hypothetical protein